MRKLFGLLIIVIGLTITPVFAQKGLENEAENTPQKKHQFLDNYFGVGVGVGGMRMYDNGIFTAALGVSYDFYLHDWLSINTGLLFHTEMYSDQNLLTDSEPMVTPLCFTIPFGVHFNIPGIEWLYSGVNVAVNIPIADLRSPGDPDFSSRGNVFVSLPIDLGVDFIKPGRGGPRVFFRVTPTFHKGGIAVPVGLVWQIYNWKVFSQKIEVNVPPPG
jgi:hypothetical protein